MDVIPPMKTLYSGECFQQRVLIPMIGERVHILLITLRAKEGH